MSKQHMNFICNKEGCKVSEELPPEIEKLMTDWDKQIDERTEKRKANGCWNPEVAVCDCPACGGPND